MKTVCLKIQAVGQCLVKTRGDFTSVGLIAKLIMALFCCCFAESVQSNLMIFNVK